MKKKIAIATGLLLTGAASAVDLVLPWDGSPTAFDAEIGALIDHMDDPGNYYLDPDHSGARHDVAGDLFSVTDAAPFINLYAIGKRAGGYHKFGFKITQTGGTAADVGVGLDRIVELTPDDDVPGPDDSAIFPGPLAGLHTSLNVLDLFYTAGTQTGGVTFTGSVNFFIENADGSEVWSGDIFSTKNFTGILTGATADLTTGTPATPLPALHPALDIIPSEFQVWGFEDIPVATSLSLVDGSVVVPDKTIAGDDVIKGEPDYQDWVFALGVSDEPITPVPEPSTYGLIGAVALLGLIAHRRYKLKKA